jgi:hypothetical protein
LGDKQFELFLSGGNVGPEPKTIFFDSPSPSGELFLVNNFCGLFGRFFSWWLAGGETQNSSKGCPFTLALLLG